MVNGAFFPLTSHAGSSAGPSLGLQKEDGNAKRGTNGAEQKGEEEFSCMLIHVQW